MFQPSGFEGNGDGVLGGVDSGVVEIGVGEKFDPRNMIEELELSDVPLCLFAQFPLNQCKTM